MLVLVFVPKLPNVDGLLLWPKPPLPKPKDMMGDADEPGLVGRWRDGKKVGGKTREAGTPFALKLRCGWASLKMTTGKKKMD